MTSFGANKCSDFSFITGPDKWHIEFPVAKEGKRQSPIDLSAELAQTDSGLRKTPITVKYEAKNTLNIENTGASWKVNVDGAGSCLTGGALQVRPLPHFFSFKKIMPAGQINVLLIAFGKMM